MMLIGKFFGSFVSKNAKYIFALLALLGVFWQVNSWVNKQREEKRETQEHITRLTKDLDTSQKNFELAQATANHNKEMLDVIIAEKLKTEKISADLKKDVATSRAFSQQLLDKINTSKPEDDGPIAPILFETIDAIQKKNKGAN